MRKIKITRKDKFTEAELCDVLALVITTLLISHIAFNWEFVSGLINEYLLK